MLPSMKTKGFGKVLSFGNDAYEGICGIVHPLLSAVCAIVALREDTSSARCCTTGCAFATAMNNASIPTAGTLRLWKSEIKAFIASSSSLDLEMLTDLLSVANPFECGIERISLLLEKTN